MNWEPIETLPETEGHLIVANEHGWAEAWFEDYDREGKPYLQTDGGRFYNATHWMRPELPAKRVLEPE